MHTIKLLILSSSTIIWFGANPTAEDGDPTFPSVFCSKYWPYSFIRLVPMCNFILSTPNSWKIDRCPQLHLTVHIIEARRVLCDLGVCDRQRSKTACALQAVVLKLWYNFLDLPAYFIHPWLSFYEGTGPKLHIYLGFERSCWMAITRIQRGLVAWELPTQDFRWETLPNCRAVLIQQSQPSLNISWFQRESWLRGWHCSADVYSKAPLSCLVSLKTRTLPPPLLCAF